MSRKEVFLREAFAFLEGVSWIHRMGGWVSLGRGAGRECELWHVGLAFFFFCEIKRYLLFVHIFGTLMTKY